MGIKDIKEEILRLLLIIFTESFLSLNDSCLFSGQTKVKSNGQGLVDFVVRQVDSVFHLPERQLKVLEKN